MCPSEHEPLIPTRYGHCRPQNDQCHKRRALSKRKVFWHLFFVRERKERKYEGLAGATAAGPNCVAGTQVTIAVCHLLINTERFDNSIDHSRNGVLLRFDMHGETELMQRC